MNTTGVWRVEVWEPVDCGRCGRPVQFRRGQVVNTCAYCGLVVIRQIGGVE